MKKRIFSMLLAFVMALSLLPTTALADGEPSETLSAFKTAMTAFIEKANEYGWSTLLSDVEKQNWKESIHNLGDEQNEEFLALSEAAFDAYDNLEDEDMEVIEEENSEYSRLLVEATEIMQVLSSEAASERTALTEDTQVLSGDYYLDDDITMEKVLWLKSGNATIDLNGHVLTLKSGSYGIRVDGGTLTIKDSDPIIPHKFESSPGVWTLKENGDKTIYGGVITGAENRYESDGCVDDSKQNIAAGAICIYVGSVVMQGGNIVGNKVSPSGYVGTDASGGAAVYVAETASFTMNGGSLQGNAVPDGNTQGGAIWNKGTLAISESSVISGNYINSTEGLAFGGGIYNEGTITAFSGTVSGNTAKSGGGIYNAGTITAFSGEVSGNTADGDGGGIYNTNAGEISTLSAAISDNWAGISGGGIYNEGTITTLSGTVSGNTANCSGSNAGGGGIYNTDTGEIATLNATINDNTAGISGGGIYNEGTITTLSGTVSGNEADSGGGIHNKGTISDLSATVSGNTADNRGGGICNLGTITTLSAMLSGNTATQFGGGICNWGTIEDFSGTVSGNTATQFGGGIINFATLMISGNAKVSDNTINSKANNVAVLEGCTIQLKAALDDTARIGVKLLGEANGAPIPGLVVSGSEYDIKPSDREKFFSDDKHFVVSEIKNDNTLYLEECEKINGSITVVVKKGDDPLGSATVALQLDGTTDATANTDASGECTFENLVPGIYNVVVTHDVLTYMESAELTRSLTLTVELPDGKTGAEVTVGSGTPAVTAKGLKAVAEKEREGIDDADTVKVELVVKSKDEADVPETDKTAINGEANGKTVEFLDMEINKYLNGTLNESITDTGANVLEIIIPFTTSGRRDITVYRYHGSTVTAFTKLNTRPTTGYVDATFYVGSDYVAVYTTKFSTYAIGYNLGEGSNPSHTGGGSGGSVTRYGITLPTDLSNGKLAVDKTKASAGSIVTITVSPDKGYTLETLSVLDKSGKEIALTEKDGKYSFKMPSANVEITATFMDDNRMLNFFVDVPADSYYYDAVLWAAENGITAGTDDTHFSPAWDTTRAQMITFLWRAMGSPEPETSSCAFTDLDPDAYYYKAVLWAAENGYTEGTSKTTFSPDVTVTRCQAVAFLWRIAGKLTDIEENPFNDVVEGKYYYDAVKWAFKTEITDGTGETTFSPDENCLRAQIVTFLYRYFVK